MADLKSKHRRIDDGGICGKARREFGVEALPVLFPNGVETAKRIVHKKNIPTYGQAVSAEIRPVAKVDVIQMKMIERDFVKLIISRNLRAHGHENAVDRLD